MRATTTTKGAKAAPAVPKFVKLKHLEEKPQLEHDARECEAAAMFLRDSRRVRRQTGAVLTTFAAWRAVVSEHKAERKAAEGTAQERKAAARAAAENSNSVE